MNFKCCLFFLFSFQCSFGSYLTFLFWAGLGERKWEEKIKWLNGVHSEFTVDLNSHILYLIQVLQSCDFTSCIAEYWNYFPKLSSCGYSAAGESEVWILLAFPHTWLCAVSLVSLGLEINLGTEEVLSLQCRNPVFILLTCETANFVNTVISQWPEWVL